MQALAAIMEERSGTFVLKSVKVEDLGTKSVMVRVAASGICQTDAHARDGYFPLKYPAIYGHEGVGIVERVGRDVTSIAEGDRVMMHFPSCGTCLNCQRGKSTYCDDAFQLKGGGLRYDGKPPFSLDGKPVFGAFFQQSSFSTIAIATERNVIKAPDDIPLDILAAFPCGVNSGAGAVFNVVKPTQGSSFAVFGVGTVGMSGMMAAKVLGCDPIIAVDVHDTRLTLARELGATHSINSKKTDAVAEIKKITGRGADFILEAAGDPGVFRKSIDSLAVPGSCVLVGSARPGVEFQAEMATIQYGRSLRGSMQGDSKPEEFFPLAFDLFRKGKFPIDKLVKYYDFKDINQAIDDSGSGKTIKAILRMPK